jgi:predicted CoA-substrate-specific enzyme activase
VIRYVCKYTPVELILAFGEEAVLYNPMPDNLDLADELTHRNVCSFSRALIAGQAAAAAGLPAPHPGPSSQTTTDPSGSSSAATSEEAMLVLTDCCDSIRRAADVLRSLGQAVLMLSVPRRLDECSRALFKGELVRVLEEMQTWTGKAFDAAAFRCAFDPAAPDGGPHVAVMGARMGNALLEETRRRSPFPVLDNTCTGLRRLGPPPEAGIEELMDWYAGELLAQPACMRMIDLTSRRALTEDPNLRGVIYNTVKFCDFYGFEYAALRDVLRVPMLKIETDYTAQGAAQVLTRLQAFFEGVDAAVPASAAALRRNGTGYFAGVDSGSTTTNAVILDGDRNIVSFCTLLTGVQVAETAALALEGALEGAGLRQDQIQRTITTGYGRACIAFRERDVTEITCHARGAHFLNPAVRTVIDMGGQDSKVIRLDDRGGVRNFVMNDKCAAGTGRFLEMMAQSLGLSMEEMGVRGLTSREEITISSMCSVFAQSEVVSLLASGKRLEDIVRGLNRSVAAKVTALAGRSGLEREWMMTGGVARNPGVVAAVEERLGGKVILPAEPELCGALGAALIAMEEGAPGCAAN